MEVRSKFRPEGAKPEPDLGQSTTSHFIISTICFTANKHHDHWIDEDVTVDSYYVIPTSHQSFFALLLGLLHWDLSLQLFYHR